ncbi:MAG: glycosyltransferase family 1 protein [Candidatus Cloacimonetes bacterium]|nr:glycosyltransferase family 1 protein [Candidatus Cloacimonadota bacterium]
MKMLFLVFHGFSEYNGISKKIHYQVDGLKENGHEVHLCYYSFENADGHRKRMIDNNVLEDFGCDRFAPLRKRVKYSSIVQYAKEQEIEFVYMRSDHNANPFTINMVKNLRKLGIKIVMEIPTYPYDQEYISKRMKVELAIDRLFRKQLARNLSAIVTFSDYKEIFGTQTIRISNGIDFSNIKLKERINDTSECLNLLGVAEVHYWHGFDRVIRGLAEYYKQPQTYKVYFHIAGNISGIREQSEIVDAVNVLHLNKYVYFHGALFGEELDEMFEKCDLGIGSLGRHRSGIDKIKTLKNREYAARGIPFIYSETDSDFEKMSYIIKAGANDSPIDIESLIRFYKTHSFSPQKIRESISDLSWKNQMQKVIQESIMINQ